MRARRGELSASAAVLSLLIEQPDSIAGLTRRLPERFPQAGFGRNAPHKVFPSLQRQGLIRVVDRGRLRSLDRYAATRDGHESFRESLRASSAAVPVVRDALRARLEHVDDEDELREVIAAICEQEEICVTEYLAARKRFRASTRAHGSGERGEECLRDLVGRALLIDEAVLWGSRATRLKRMREGLQFGVDLDEADDDGSGGA